MLLHFKIIALTFLVFLWTNLPGQSIVDLCPISQPTQLLIDSTKALSKQSKWADCVMPLTLVAYGGYLNSHRFILDKYAIRSWSNTRFQNFSTDIDDYLQFAPIVASYALSFNLSCDESIRFNKNVVLTEAFVLVSVSGLKKITHVARPDGSSRNSFPSGHTTQAFAAATLFSDHFAKHKWWLQSLAYGSAMTVGALRVLNDRHWASDVIAGAGLGILCAKLSEKICKPVSNRRQSFSIYGY